MTCKNCIHQCNWAEDPYETCERFKSKDLYDEVPGNKPESKFIVKTKFNVNDIVYVADSYYDHWYLSEVGKILEINIIIRDNKKYISYTVKNKENITINCPEQWLFATSHEGMQWCNARNRKGIS